MADKQQNETLDEILKRLEEAEKEYAEKLENANLDQIIAQEEAAH